ncbi:hypothetical protein NQZ79_g8216 [Umbelopsis isabellina]|nr:hypothetical protein NQZ79_g8216 [Umbelopsis isabellina]
MPRAFYSLASTRLAQRVPGVQRRPVNPANEERASNTEFDDGGVSIVEMLYRTNYLALVGGGRNPRYPPNRVIIFDNIKGKSVVELEYKSDVRNVKLRRDRLIVITSNKVFVYVFSLNPQKLHSFETIDNPHGLAAVSPSQEHAILAFPGRQQGHIQVVDLNKINSTTSVLSPTSPNNAGKTMQSTTTNVSIIAAHSGQLSCLAMNFDGTKCATASEKGTLIRIFDTATGQLLNELRRGMDRAEIYSIAFNKESTRICVSSDKGTIHIFNLDASVVASAERTPRGPTYGEVTPSHSSSLPGFTHSGNRGSSFRFMKDLLPKYFSSEWSFAHATIPSETRCVVGFGEQTNSIIEYKSVWLTFFGPVLSALCADGACYKFLFDPRKGGECSRESYERFYSPFDDD